MAETFADSLRKVKVENPHDRDVRLYKQAINKAITSHARMAWSRGEKCLKGYMAICEAYDCYISDSKTVFIHDRRCVWHDDKIQKMVEDEIKELGFTDYLVEVYKEDAIKRSCNDGLLKQLKNKIAPEVVGTNYCVYVEIKL